MVDATEVPNPLGPSYILLPLPQGDTTLLGRVVDEPPTAGRSLSEVARPNVCAEKLSAVSTSPLVGSFENAEELAYGANASAALATFGFTGSASRATHFVYRLQTTEQAVIADTVEYAECCRASGQCGYGFITALVKGTGEYAAAQELAASANADFVFMQAGGSGAYRALNRRSVGGYFAALVRVTGPKVPLAGDAGPLGLIQETPASELVRRQYETRRIDVFEIGGGRWAFRRDGRLVSENAFAETYTEVTGSDELTVFDRNRVPGLLWASGAGTVIGAVGLTYAVSVNDPWTRADQGNVCGDLACASAYWGTALLAVSAPLFVLSLTLFRDGGDEHHYLSEFEGRTFANRHNRLLLRKLRQQGNEYQRRSEEVEVNLNVSPNGPMIHGTF